MIKNVCREGNKMRRNQYKGTLQGVEASEPYARGYADRATSFRAVRARARCKGRQVSEL